jgi:hypothetical protein
MKGLDGSCPAPSAAAPGEVLDLGAMADHPCRFTDANWQPVWSSPMENARKKKNVAFIHQLELLIKWIGSTLFPRFG